MTTKEVLWEILEFFLHTVSEKDKLDGKKEHFKYRLSLGRSSWIVWFYATIYFIAKGIILSYLWYLIGLSILGYVIGTKYIIKGIAGKK